MGLQDTLDAPSDDDPQGLNLDILLTQIAQEIAGQGRLLEQRAKMVEKGIVAKKGRWFGVQAWNLIGSKCLPQPKALASIVK